MSNITRMVDPPPEPLQWAVGAGVREAVEPLTIPTNTGPFDRWDLAYIGDVLDHPIRRVLRHAAWVIMKDLEWKRSS